MREPDVHQCQCSRCQGADDHPDKAQQHRINLFLSRLDEQQAPLVRCAGGRSGGLGGDRC